MILNCKRSLGRLEVGQEELREKVTEVFEALDSYVEINKRQHEEIMRELKGEISIIELAVKRAAT